MATEKRLIDARWLTSQMYLICEAFQTENIFIDAIIDEIDNAPDVDAVVLPCKIGDKVYRIDKGNYHSNWNPFVQELTVTEISWKKEKYGDKDLGFAIIADGIRYKFTSIGKSVFLTRKEAEAKMDGDGNG